MGEGLPPRAKPLRLLLASASPSRRALLVGAGLNPEVVVPSVNGKPLNETELLVAANLSLASAETQVLALAQAKAEAVLPLLAEKAEPQQTCLILGCDSMFVLGGQAYGKPRTAAAARRRWQEQRGATGTLYSGHWLIAVPAEGPLPPALDPVSASAVSAAQVTFADDLEEEEMEAYIASGEPLNVAGGFTLEALGAPFISRIVGDPSGVMGLSLPTLRQLVRQLGYQWTELWSQGRKITCRPAAGGILE